jgi:hypothetical protein
MKSFDASKLAYYVFRKIQLIDPPGLQYFSHSTMAPLHYHHRKSLHFSPALISLQARQRYGLLMKCPLLNYNLNSPNKASTAFCLWNINSRRTVCYLRVPRQSFILNAMFQYRLNRNKGLLIL